MKNETSDTNDTVTVRTSAKDVDTPVVTTQAPDASKSVNLDGAELPDTHSHSPYSEPPKSKKKLFIALAAALVIILAGVAAVYFLLLQRPAETAKETDPLAAATKFASPQALVDAVEPDLDGVVTEVAGKTGVSAYDADGYYIYGAPVYKESGDQFGVLPLTVTGGGYVSDSVKAAANYAALTDFFKNHKFAERVTDSDIAGPVSDADDDVRYDDYAEYESSNLLCTIYHADATPTLLAAHIVGIGCADKASYAEAKRVLQPFYESYIKVNKEVSKNLEFGLQKQSNGSSEYNYALLYQDDDAQFDKDEEVKSLVGYYYKKAGDRNWTHFMTMKIGEVPYCATFNTEVLRQAFAGIDCYDEASQRDSRI